MTGSLTEDAMAARLNFEMKLKLRSFDGGRYPHSTTYGPWACPAAAERVHLLASRIWVRHRDAASISLLDIPETSQDESFFQPVSPVFFQPVLGGLGPIVWWLSVKGIESSC